MGRLRHDDGVIGVLAVVLLFAVLVATSLAVDIGRYAYVSRDLQGTTDRAALDSVRVLGDRSHEFPASNIHELWVHVRDEVERSLERNYGSSGVANTRETLQVVLGYATDDDTFAPVYDGSTQYSTVDPDAVRVVTESEVGFIFALGDPEGSRIAERVADATTKAIATISIGTTLVSVNSSNSPWLSRLLGALVGGNVNITAAGYNGLATAYIPLSVLGDAGAEVGTVDKILASNITVADLLDATIDGLATEDPTLHAEAITALTTIRTALTLALDLTVGDLFDISTVDTEAFLRSRINVLDLVVGSLLVATGQEFLNLGTVSGTNILGLNGLLSVAAQVRLIEPPQFATGPARQRSDGTWVTRAESAQVEVTLSTTMSTSQVQNLLGSTLSGLLNTLLCLPILGLITSCPSSQTIGISVVGGAGSIDLTGIDCADPVEASVVTSLVQTDAATATFTRGSNTRNVTLTGGFGPGAVIFDGVPTSHTVSGAIVADSPLLDRVVYPLLGLLGADAGHAKVTAHDVDCAHRRLLPMVID